VDVNVEGGFISSSSSKKGKKGLGKGLGHEEKKQTDITEKGKKGTELGKKTNLAICREKRSSRHLR